MFREPPARRDRMRVHVSAAEEAAGDAPMAVSSTPRGADIPRLTIDRDGHRQVAFHCSTAGIFIMACPPRNTRQQSPACHHRAIPQPVAACARCTAIPRPAGPPRPGRPWGAADRVHASLPNTRLPSPRVFRRQALSVPLSALPHGRPSRRGPGWRRGRRLPCRGRPTATAPGRGNDCRPPRLVSVFMPMA